MKILANYADWNHTSERRKLNGYGGIGYYRIIKPTEQVKGHEIKVIGKEILVFGDDLESQWDNIFKEYDVFWCNYFSDDKAGAAMMYHRDKHKKKVIIDIDDNFLDIPTSNKIYDKFKNGTKDRAFLTAILSLADAITVSTEPLKERLKAHLKKVYGIDKQVYVIPNMNDVNDWQVKIADKPTDKVVIGYSGSNSHADDMAIVLPVIEKLMTKYPNLYFEMIGTYSKEDAVKAFQNWDKKLLDRVGMVGATATFKEFPQWLADREWHIGIAPLVDTPFTRAKSHIKWMEYSMVKLPTIASRVYPYYMDVGRRQTIEDGETGLLCKPDEWEKKLAYLIEHPEERERIGNNAYEFVKQEWQYKDGEIDKCVQQMLKEI